MGKCVCISYCFSKTKFRDHIGKEVTIEIWLIFTFLLYFLLLVYFKNLLILFSPPPSPSPFSSPCHPPNFKLYSQKHIQNTQIPNSPKPRVQTRNTKQQQIHIQNAIINKTGKTGTKWQNSRQITGNKVKSGSS